MDPQVVAWRRDLHHGPELGNREFRTSQEVAEQLRAMGPEVRTGIAQTGVVGILRGGQPARWPARDAGRGDYLQGTQR